MIVVQMAGLWYQSHVMVHSRLFRLSRPMEFGIEITYFFPVLYTYVWPVMFTVSISSAFEKCREGHGAMVTAWRSVDVAACRAVSNPA